MDDLGLQPTARTDSFVAEIETLRRQLGSAIGAARPLSAAEFAQELTARLGIESLNSSTAWRWLNGKSRPPRAMFERLCALSRTMADVESAADERVSETEEAIRATCLRARVRVLHRVLESAPKELVRADGIARVVEEILALCSSHVGITENDAYVLMWQLITHATDHPEMRKQGEGLHLSEWGGGELAQRLVELAGLLVGNEV